MKKKTWIVIPVILLILLFPHFKRHLSKDVVKAGLIIDLYGDHAVVQCHSLGMYRLRDTFARILQELLPEGPDDGAGKQGGEEPLRHTGHRIDQVSFYETFHL